MTIIQKYFTNLTGLQVEQFAQLEALYNDWNAKINVISRKDIQNLYEHHVLHSLGIAKVVNFRDETTVMDLGTGGGFPGIPLAILFPHVQFHLVDSVGKKVKVANEVATAIGLKNVKFSHARAEEIKEQYDFVVTRAVMPMVDLVKVARKNIKKEQHNAVPNGIIALKGGELNGEIASMKNIATVWELSDFF
ncbi:MAG: 16S rRNA (guanine(527)-N(7))-methyltransferase RsmG, partial [Bacteroidaceae bacterium]|nr:16S rRNA (guanine(527)-N(7))-methyltransferase RsmG [Bacteroidaceae bacterium]